MELVGMCAAITLICTIVPGRASAANSLYACFTLGGRAIPVSLAGLEATNRYGNWVPTILGRRYDAFCYLDETTALHPLTRSSCSCVPSTRPFPGTSSHAGDTRELFVAAA